MSKVFISHDATIEWTGSEVTINGKPMTIEGAPSEEHALNEMRSCYGKVLTSHFENLIILTGSGSSVGIGKYAKGETMKGLCSCVLDEIGKEKVRGLCDSIDFDFSSLDDLDLEALLSKANAAIDFVKVGGIKELVEAIKGIIKEHCNLVLPDSSPHEKMLEKITARKLKYPRVKLFTLNYDTLFEQAASRNGYVVIDGFSFTYPRKFNGRHFDYDIVIRENSRIKNEENYAKRVLHLYKPHGSLDWEREGDYIKKVEVAIDPVLMYPDSNKYEYSYELPFFEMMSRFQQALRGSNTFLITIGFSFYDKHISSMIREALKINPSFRLMVVDPNIEQNDNLESIRIRAEDSNNTFLVRENFSDFIEYYPYPEIYADNQMRTDGEKIDESI